MIFGGEFLFVPLQSEKIKKITVTRHEQMWNDCLKIIQDNITKEQYEAWFKKIVPVSYDDGKLILEIPSQFYFDYLEEHFADIIRLSIEKVIGRNVKLLYKVQIDHKNPKTTIDLPTNLGKDSDKLIDKSRKLEQPNQFVSDDLSDFDCHLNPRYTFESYIEGASNKLARCAGQNIAANPGKSMFNPMFIFGAPAVGKTHLANAIGIAVKQQFPKKKIIYISAHLFLMQFIDAVNNSKTNDFINFYQSIDVLIIDDIQELIRAKSTQNTFFHIFNHLLMIGKQIVICSDRCPGELEGMEERLISRFKMGLQVEIERPNYELRRDILKYKIYQDDLRVPDDVVEYVASHVTKNVRDLEGTLMSLLARSTFMSQEITTELAKQIIGTNDDIDTVDDDEMVDKILDLVCNHYDLEVDDVKSSCRKRPVSEARQIAMYLTRAHTKLSLNDIGRKIGKRDHTTVLYACNEVLNQMTINPLLCDKVHKFERMLENTEEELAK